MTNVLPQEMQFLSHRPYLSLRTKVSRKELDDGTAFIRLAQRRGIEPGDHITVQVISDDETRLIHEAEFVVFHKKVERRQVEEGNTVRTATSSKYEISRIGPWWTAPALGETGKKAPELDRDDSSVPVSGLR